MELIDRKTLDFNFDRRIFGEDDENYTRGADDAINVVMFAPTIDAVSVVRCRECRYYRNGGCYREHDKYTAWEAEDPATRTNNAPIYYGWKPTDHCSYGEPRTPPAE